MSRMRLYVGCVGADREVFRSPVTPTRESHGAKYLAVIGPFRTRRAADFMASPGGRNNPHCQSVADAERIASRLGRRNLR